MAVRPFLTTAVSVATAITVSASLALAPPMSPRDMKVASDAQVALAADEGLIKALVDGYFYDGNGTDGVIQALLLRIAGGYVPATTMINGYFDVKPPEALRQWLVANTDPTNLVALEYINRYFGDPAQPDLPSGPQEAIRLQLLAHFQDPQQVAFINDYFDNRPPGVIRTQLLVRFLDPQQQEFIKDYFGDPADPDRPFGPPIVIRNQLLARTSDPVQQALINAYFAGGPKEVLRLLLDPVDSTPAPEPLSAFSARASAPEEPPRRGYVRRVAGYLFDSGSRGRRRRSWSGSACCGARGNSSEVGDDRRREVRRSPGRHRGHEGRQQGRRGTDRSGRKQRRQRGRERVRSDRRRHSHFRDWRAAVWRCHRCGRYHRRRSRWWRQRGRLGGRRELIVGESDHG